MDVDNGAREQARNYVMDKCVSLAFSESDFSVTMKISKEVLQHTHSVDIMKEHLIAWIGRDNLEAPQITFYIKYVGFYTPFSIDFYCLYINSCFIKLIMTYRFLYEKFRPTLYKFFCPLRVAHLARSHDDLNLDDRTRYMSFAMSESSGFLWFVPYREGYVNFNNLGICRYELFL